MDAAVGVAGRAVPQWPVARSAPDRFCLRGGVGLDAGGDFGALLIGARARKSLCVAPGDLAPAGDDLEEGGVVCQARKVAVVDGRVEPASDLGVEVVGHAVE